VAKVLNSDVFNSEGNKSSTKSFSVGFNSREYVLLISFNSIAELEFEYLFFNSFITSIIELMSELVISERFFFEIGLPFRYKTASTLVISPISGWFLAIVLGWLIFNYQILIQFTLYLIGCTKK